MSLLKSTILKAYQLVPEVYRQHFRSSIKKDIQTFTEFAREKVVQFDHWCTAMEVAQDYNKLRQLIVLEELKSCLPPHIKTYLDERKADNLAEAAVFADDYSLTHKSTFFKSDTEPSGGQTNPSGTQPHMQGPRFRYGNSDRPHSEGPRPPRLSVPVFVL